MKQTFNDLTIDELIAKKKELSENLRVLRFDMVMGHVENPLEKRNLRHSISRLNAMIHNKSKDAKN